MSTELPLSSPATFDSNDIAHMRRALELAAHARDAHEEVPVGAVLVRCGAIIGEGWNRSISGNDATAHAEIVALRDAGAREGNYRLPGSTLYVTLEPCVMCAGAIVLARLDRVVYGADDPKAGAVGSLWDVVRDRRLNHRPEVISGVLAEESAELLRRFFADKR